MEKEIGQIKFTETDDGFRIDVKGKSFKEAMDCGCGCLPMFGGARMIKVECCPTDGGKTVDSGPPDKKKN